LLLLDVDRFKQINDTYGHRAGDELLAVFAQRLHRATVGREVAVRLHGDEFTLWLGAVSPDAAARRADEVAADLARPVPIAGRELVMTASVGYACGPAALADLLQRADASMYAAKRSRSALSSLPVTAPVSRPRDRGKDVG
jgi:diguanylate cyclase (GGDEF)-like protein